MEAERKELELQQVGKNYGRVCALEGFTYTFTPGIYGLLGPNGAGKSTLMKLLAGLLEPTNGSILWCKNPILDDRKEYRVRLGYVPQQQKMYDFFTGYEFMEYMAALKGIDKKTVPAMIQRCMKDVQLLEHAKRRVGTYSGGMKQRLLLAQALLGQPELLLLDEPTAGLDPKQRVLLRNLIADIGKDKIVFFATHVVSDLEMIAKEVLFLKDGRLAQVKTADELVERGMLEEFYIQCFETEGEARDDEAVEM